MINSKVTAYRKNGNDWIKVSRWELLKMSEVEYRKYKSDFFPLYLRKSEESEKLTFNLGQKTFRFLTNQFDNSERKSTGLTISHILAQEVLSELETLNLILTDKRTKPYKKIELEIKVENAITEYQFSNYKADLLIYFSEPLTYADNWNRKVALEVYTTNEVKGGKISCYEESNLALIEISLGEKLKSKKKISEIKEAEENELRRYIYNSFKKHIFGDLLVSPISEESRISSFIETKNNEVDKANEINENLRYKLKENDNLYQSLLLEYKEVKEKLNKAEFYILQQQNRIQKLNQENINLKGLNNRLNNSTLMEKIKKIFQ